MDRADRKGSSQITDWIGRTPVVKINQLVDPETHATVYVKLECFNPGGSVKDRAAYQMILEAEKKGLLREGSTIIEPTSGNTGIGLAWVGAARGYRTVFVMPDNSSKERIRLLRAYGAEVYLSPASERMPGAIRLAHEIFDETPDAFMPYQFENQANPRAHYLSTGPEIVQQMKEGLDALIATAGTGGTITGTGEFLKTHFPNLLIGVVEPKNSPVLAGGEPGNHQLPGTSPGFIPKILNQEIYDEIFHVTDEDAHETVRQLARKEGILVGPSSGASVWAALQVAKRLGPGHRVLSIAPDSGERYLSTNLFDKGE